MTTGAGRDSERFAAAVESGHTYAGAVPPGDELLARELELVNMLRHSRATLSPTTDASARMRAKVMAAAATMLPPAGDAPHSTGTLAAISAESTLDAEHDTNVVAIGSARGRHRFPRRGAAAETPHRRSPLGLSAAAALALLAITGGGALFSKDALPGDSLYGVKQTTESGLVALTPGQGKAERQLSVAATRIDEVQALNSGKTDSADRGADISQALHGFNEQTTAASRSWLAGPNSDNSSALATWASTQSQRLTSMRAAMPTSAQPDADSSIKMLDQLRTRANALNSRKGCDTVTTGQSDEFGPIPARGACTAKDLAPAPAKIVPNLPSAGERASAPALNSDSHSGSPLGTGAATDTAPDLRLPDLGSGGGLLTHRDPISDPRSDDDSGPGLHLPLLGN